MMVKAGERLLAESRAALRVMETASPPTFYLPAADVDAELLVAAVGQSVCEWKGIARYWASARCGTAAGSRVELRATHK